MDRNKGAIINCNSNFVALRKESVDRNGMEIDGVSYDVWSLSARRAWIEINSLDDILAGVNESLSARRAWIEIMSPIDVLAVSASLSARRAWIEISPPTG